MTDFLSILDAELQPESIDIYFPLFLPVSFLMKVKVR